MGIHEKHEARAERVRRADQIAEVHRLADALGADPEIAAHEFYVAAGVAAASARCFGVQGEGRQHARDRVPRAQRRRRARARRDPDAEPGPGEVRLRVRARRAEFRRHPDDQRPVSGQARPAVRTRHGGRRRHRCLRPRVAGFVPGERVMAAIGRGGFAEAAVCPADASSACRIPSTTSSRRVSRSLTARPMARWPGPGACGRARRSWCTGPRAASAWPRSNAAGCRAPGYRQARGAEHLAVASGHGAHGPDRHRQRGRAGAD